ncbi:MAG: alpha-L-rhamnosidase [Phycisphaerales bacterium]|nr:alpha-L-rhamnosidase [Phycisphaerales bacterium]
MTGMRVMLESDPFAHLNQGKTLWMRNIWPARWISHPQIGAAPVVVAYRREFKLTEEATFRLHVSADERYQLFVDGVQVGRGPERGDADHWLFETYELTLGAGRHTLVARVWSLGEGERGQMGGDAGGGAGGQAAAPYAQISVYHGLLVASDEEYLPLVATGVAQWQAKVLPGYSFAPPGVAWGTGARVEIDGAAFAWNFHRGDGEGWGPVIARHGGVTEGRMEAGPSHTLRPATLPAMIERYVKPGRIRFVDDATSGRVQSANDLASERETMQTRLANRHPLRFEAGVRRRVIIDLENYYCAYPLLVCSGGRGAVMRLLWAESLYETPDVSEKRKGNRNEIEGKYFIGVGDVFRPDGGSERQFETLWWAAGRYLELTVETADQPLELNFVLRETRYPLEMTAAFESSDPRLAATLPILLRGVQMCAHETYMDCPYYEQLMYVGDTRLEALVTYAVSANDCLPRKAIALFDGSRLASGLVQSRYPSRVRQVIPPFALWWIGMLHDFAMWRDDAAFVRSMMPGVRAVIEAYMSFRNADGLVAGPASGWNYVDWTPGWKNGVPPDGDYGVSSVINWQFVYALRMAKELEEWFGEPEMAARCDRISREVAAEIGRQFWEPVRGLFADDREKSKFSEHAQCLAILSGLLSDQQCAQIGDALLINSEMARTTIYFTHYLFEAYHVLGTPARAAFFERLSLWFDLGKHGFVTPFEEPEPSRSDCHGWGSHPLFHYLATVLGVRPGGVGFATVEVRPNLGPLTRANWKVSHPAGGFVEVQLERQGDALAGTIVLPKGVTGTFGDGRHIRTLMSGRNVVGS